MKFTPKTLKYLLNIDLVISGLGLAILIVITFLGVVMRYFLNNPYIWLEEVQLWCFVWIVFFGAGAAFRSGSHVAIDIVVDLMPAKLKKIIAILGYVAVMYVLFYLLQHGSTLVNQLARTGRTTNILKVPYPMIYSVLPIGCAMMMINYTLITAGLLFGKSDSVEDGDVEWI